MKSGRTINLEEGTMKKEIPVGSRQEGNMETKELFKEVQALRHKICLVVGEQDSLEDNANIALVRAMVKWEGETIHALTLKEV